MLIEELVKAEPISNGSCALVSAHWQSHVHILIAAAKLIALPFNLETWNHIVLSVLILRKKTSGIPSPLDGWYKHRMVMINLHVR
jgi:hypothetical protein